jgi:hypothetical protein
VLRPRSGRGMRMAEGEGAEWLDSDDLARNVRVRLAGSRDELDQAYRLVYASYRQRGYIEENPSGLRLTVFNVFPTTVTFVSLLGSEVIATVTVVPDTPVGLPMDEIYSEELQPLRAQNRKLAEVTMLADRRREIRRALPMLLLLMKHVFDYATLVLGANDLCITINPRHERYYGRSLLFRHLGPLRTYPSVRENPALAKRLDLDRARDECEGNDELLDLFFNNRTPVSALGGGHRMTQDDLHYFLVETTSILRDASPKALRCLKRFYPDCPWDDWRASL